MRNPVGAMMTVALRCYFKTELLKATFSVSTRCQKKLTKQRKAAPCEQKRVAIALWWSDWLQRNPTKRTNPTVDDPTNTDRRTGCDGYNLSAAAKKSLFAVHRSTASKQCQYVKMTQSSHSTQNPAVSLLTTGPLLWQSSSQISVCVCVWNKPNWFLCFVALK